MKIKDKVLRSIHKSFADVIFQVSTKVTTLFSLFGFGKNSASCPYLLKSALYQFKRVNKIFFLKISFNCKSRNLIYVVICQGR